MTDKKQHWTVEPSAYRMERDYKPVVIVYDPTPGGRRNDNGTMTHALRFPALALTEWVGEPEKAAKEVAEALNGYDNLKAQLERANRIIGWMMRYIGSMCPPPNGLSDLNIHCCENRVPEPGDSTKGRPINQRLPK